MILITIIIMFINFQLRVKEYADLLIKQVTFIFIKA